MKIWEVEHAETVYKVSQKYGHVQGMEINLYSKYHNWATLSQCVPIRVRGTDTVCFPHCGVFPVILCRTFIHS